MKKEVKKIKKTAVKFLKEVKTIKPLEGDFGSAKIDEMVAKINEIISYLNK